MLLTRQSPLVPFTVLNLAYGLSGVRLSTFVLRLIGILPVTLSTGQPVGMDPWLRLLRMETGPGESQGGGDDTDPIGLPPPHFPASAVEWFR